MKYGDKGKPAYTGNQSRSCRWNGKGRSQVFRIDDRFTKDLQFYEGWLHVGDFVARDGRQRRRKRKKFQKKPTTDQ